MKKAKRKRPVVARKRKVTARKKPATPRKRRKAKMTSKKSSDDDEEGGPPRHTPSHPTGTRQAGTTQEQRTAGQPTQTSDPVELAKQEQGDPMGQPPDSPVNPNMPPDDHGPLTKPAEGQRRDK
jgi:hypothetical protein